MYRTYSSCYGIFKTRLHFEEGMYHGNICFKDDSWALVVVCEQKHRFHNDAAEARRFARDVYFDLCAEATYIFFSAAKAEAEAETCFQRL